MTKGIEINMGFDLGAELPLDNRSIQETIVSRNNLITQGKAYEGMEVYCKDTKKKYYYTGDSWEEVGTGNNDGNLLVATSSDEMNDLAIEENLGKTVLYLGDEEDNTGLTKGEKYFLHWNAISINYANFAYEGNFRLDYKKLKDMATDRTSYTVTSLYGNNNSPIWYTTWDGGAGNGTVNFGINYYGKPTIKDRIKLTCTVNSTTRNSYSWISLNTLPYVNTLITNWYNTNKVVRYSNGIEGNKLEDDGALFKLIGDKLSISKTSSEITNLNLDKEKFLENCNYRGYVYFVWNATNSCFNLKQDYYLDENVTFTKEDLNKYGITYDGDITINENYILVEATKYENLSSWKWKRIQGKSKSSIWKGTKAEYETITEKDENVTYITTDEEDSLDINNMVIDDDNTSDFTTWSSKKTNKEFKKIHKKNTSVTTTVYQWFVARYDSQTKQVSTTIPITIADDVSNVSLNFGDRGVLLHTVSGEVEQFPTQISAIGIEDSKSLGLLRFDIKVDSGDTSINCIAIPAGTTITFS